MNKPTKLRVEMSTYCQLRCPSCPTALGAIREKLGSGFLNAENFKSLLKDSPYVREIELSNWGEVFLNPEFTQILQTAYKSRVTVNIENGVHLNKLSDESAEALVRYQVNKLSCSIDGATQSTYVHYRQGGNLYEVIKNIRKINSIKAKFHSYYPRLRWQFILFEHNAHELSTARKLANELGMGFWVKLSWDATLAPQHPTLPSTDGKMLIANRNAYFQMTGNEYESTRICPQLWKSPQINWDGEVLGCCVNQWGGYGNAFERGLEAVLKGEKYRYAQQMLLGKKPPRTDIPCIHCTKYKQMRKKTSYISNDVLA